MSETHTPGKIRKLDQVVVNRIAAGEIIQRPANALKELIENSLDANSTNIIISIKDGGLKFLQIQDNGTGINKEDLDIVCERFTTSKLQDFNDLKSIATYGFRGEALASISHIAQLTITTKTDKEKCAYKASYVDGKLKAPPVPCAGNRGTTITVENLFYNVATRRKALNNVHEEHTRIKDVVIKYAVHNAHVGFTFKRHGHSTVYVKTPSASTKVNNIKSLYPAEVALNLFEVELEDTMYKFKLHAIFTSASYADKKMTMLLFINNRLVESSIMKKVIEDMYTVYLPLKKHPWCYISLHIDPQNIDVNIHPTKHEVRFLHEDAIIGKVRDAISEKLLDNNHYRIFTLNNAPPKLELPKELMEQVLSDDFEDNQDKPKKVHAKDFVRTDAADQKLDKFNFTINSAEITQMATDKNNEVNDYEVASSDCQAPDVSIQITNANEEINDKDGTEVTKDSEKGELEKNLDTLTVENDEEADKMDKNDPHSPEIRPPVHFRSYSVNEIQVETKLLSVLTLRKEVEESYHQGLRVVLSNLIFVGCIDEHSALIQSGPQLYSCQTEKLAEDLFYQIMLYDFANYGVIKFTEPILIKDLAKLGLECEESGWTEEAGDKNELAERVQELLLEKADMLRQYFSIYIDKKGRLKTLPYLIDCQRKLIGTKKSLAFVIYVEKLRDYTAKSILPMIHGNTLLNSFCIVQSRRVFCHLRLILKI
ncbi:DNA mismatch repair protein Mlh1 isoform X2 [Copidosoma floridanum]|uniref:DNA mismatch repair protein Mlh1 isoform X2 n=1 Tax=Copidosoma floridanum TaxID=29053 RepID=UPI0006C9E1F3|nr:DNA mismatch repair protein Mlh1 isoform X2 [Copidosoma floridanum]